MHASVCSATLPGRGRMRAVRPAALRQPGGELRPVPRSPEHRLRAGVVIADARKKDGKIHDDWSVVENRRCSDGLVPQHQVLYQGVINASQSEAWRKTIELQAGHRQA